VEEERGQGEFVLVGKVSRLERGRVAGTWCVQKLEGENLFSKLEMAGLADPYLSSESFPVTVAFSNENLTRISVV
jgi:hypothetical protein